MTGRDPIDPVAGRTASEWDGLVDDLSALTVWPPVGPIVLVAPHPDDELLATGATLAAASDAGTEIRVAAVTDGEMSHPHLSDSGRRYLVERRLVETDRAYEAAGIAATRTRFSLPDFGAATDADGWGERLAERLVPLVDGAAVLLAPWEGDGHPDHDVCGRVAVTVAVAAEVPLVSFPVWSWNWDRPDAPAIPFQRAVRFDLDVGLLARKQAGIAAYASQIHAEDGNRPVLPAGFLTHFTRPAEVFLFSG
ncbi:MAG: PIG-L family deacetylase [Actinomycetota bacterium]|nr:PIG-L family deacetylase [Actinomycetota bacterium]